MSIKRKLIIYFLDILVTRFLPIREEFCIRISNLNFQNQTYHKFLTTK